MPERSDLLDSANLPDGTAASQRFPGVAPCSPSELRRGIVDVGAKADADWDEDPNRPIPDSIRGGVCGRPTGYQR